MAITYHVMIIVKLTFFCVIVFSLSEAIEDDDHIGGITTSLFHRDSPLSPLYNPSLSHYDRLRNAFLRSISRSKTLIGRVTSSSDIIQSPLTPVSGDFLMHFSVGTPPVEIAAYADTGSDLMWTQCLPCKKCYNQSQPLFNPQLSFSYHPVPCTSDYCRAINVAGCKSGNRTCEYKMIYANHWYTNGELGYEKITLETSNGIPFAAENIVIGCGHENVGNINSSVSGIIGLGGGVLSLVSQLYIKSQIPRQFSYCLPSIFNDSNPIGKINFGNNGVVSGSEVISTPIISKNPHTFYFVTLEAISVGNNRLPLQGTTNVTETDGKGNVIIDSGTTLTYLPRNFYYTIVSALEEVIKEKRVDDPFGLLDLCYVTDDVDIDIPIITAHFTGADLKLQPSNTFMKVADNVICFTFASSEDLGYFAILGNLAQRNFLIGFDLDKSELVFKPSICA